MASVDILAVAGYDRAAGNDCRRTPCHGRIEGEYAHRLKLERIGNV